MNAALALALDDASAAESRALLIADGQRTVDRLDTRSPTFFDDLIALRDIVRMLPASPAGGHDEHSPDLGADHGGSLHGTGTEPAASGTGPRRPTAGFYSHDDKRSKGKRQKANDAAIALLRRVQSGELSRDQLTDADRATLAAYSGNGGGLIGADGKKGSDYEYYTPAALAAGIWDALAELGFAGGKILDPCSGTGIFGAVAPANAVVDAVELDETSGGINDLVNGGPGFSVTVSPFEAVAAATPDETYDAVVSNVPFSKDVDARGGNQRLDPKYQKEPMETYFILRSLDKLKPNGLAAFIVPPRVVSHRDARGRKLRERASLKAEFLGAYRLPNSVFGAADADTITDVIFFRKFSRPVAEKVAELREQSPATLGTAKVLWDEFLDGQYFQGEGRRFILGEFVPKNPDDFRPVDRVVSPASVPEIAKMLRRFPGSRIDWGALDATETAPIVYRDGDTIAQDGQTLELRDGVWVALESSQRDTQGEALLADFATPYRAFETGRTFADARTLAAFMRDSGQALNLPGWLASILRGLDKSLPNDDARAGAWKPVVVGLSALQVLDERAADTGVKFLDEYLSLSEAMKNQAAAARSLKGLDGEARRALLTIGAHYTRQAGYSALWRGDIQAETKTQTSAAHGFEGLLYRNRSQWATLEQAREIFGADFDPLTSDEWCLSADGQSVCRADDYYVGNLGEFVRRIDAEMANAPNEAVRSKLMRQKAVASERIDTVDVSRLTFNLFSPYVTQEEKLQFLRRFVHPSATTDFDNDGKPRIVFDIRGSKLGDREKLVKRLGAYLKNGTVTLGGAELSGMSDAQGIKELRAMIVKANEQFNAWARGNEAITARIAARANDPDKLRFRQQDDEAPLSIPGMNPALTLHGYQNAYVRASAREFSGINGFNVGLGKTFTALAAVQYAQAMGVKKKTVFVVPNSVLSNWRKEADRAYASTDDCLYVGLRDGKVKSAAYDEDLHRIMENRHAKIFMTQEAFERIRLRDATIGDYEAYMRRVDSSFAESEDKKKDERAESKVGSIMEILSKKSGAAPYLEDLGIDSLVADEAHAYKNASSTTEFKGGKYLSISPASKRGLDMQAKAWVIRGASGARGDGVMLLTATPITNSPLEVYSMLSLAVGHDRVNDMMGGKRAGETVGIAGADDFMNVFCRIESETDVTIDGQVRETNIFRGLSNVDLLRRSLRQVATIKDAGDVGGQIQVPDAPERPTAIALSAETEERLTLYKNAYRYAADDLAERSENRGDPDAYEAVAEFFGEEMDLIGHPFNLINKMTMLIADPDLDRRVTRYLIGENDAALAEKAVAQWNAKPPIETRSRPGPNAAEEEAKSVKIIKNDEGDVIGREFKMPVKAWIEGGAILIDSTDANTQELFENLAAKLKLDFDVAVPPKLAALLENFQVEAATPRGIDADGNRLSFAKQLIFCDLLGMHNKIRTLLTKRAGVASGAIAIVTGQRNNSADDILEVQDGFNATGADNKYRVVIANEKAEVGINLQKGTQAIHHLTIGWTPDSLTQRNGRGVRQGNRTEQVTIYYYDADGTFDTAKRTLVGSKADWINGLMANDGEDQIDIAGGMSREQMEALIDVVGDADAVTRVQEMMAAKEAEKRASTNREKQRINLDTIVKQNEFLTANARAQDWIARQMGQYLTLSAQIDKLKERRANPKASATAQAKNAALLEEANIKLQALASRINDAATFHGGTRNWSGGGQATFTRNDTTLTPAELLARFLQSAKRGENRAEHFDAAIRKGWIGYGTAFEVEIHPEAELVQDWQSEIDMATRMRDESVERYERQATWPGGLPGGVARAMAEGRGVLVGEIPVIEGCFITHSGVLNIVGPIDDGPKSTVYSDKGDNPLFRLLPKGVVIYPGTSEYDAALTRAAEIEDGAASDGEIMNVYSDRCPEVAARRTTPMLVSYPSTGYLLPAPHFPLPIVPDLIEDGAAVLKRIADDQKTVILKWKKNYYSWSFVVPNSLAVEKVPANDIGMWRVERLRDYAIAHGLRLTPADLDSADKRAVNNLLEPFYNPEELDAWAGDSPSLDEIDRLGMRFLEKYAPWLDPGSDVDATSFLPSPMVIKIEEFLSQAMQRAYEAEEADMAAKRAAAGETTPPPAPPAATGGRPTDRVLVVGDTKPHKERIKDAARAFGGYKWDKFAGGWWIQRQAFDKLIQDSPYLAGKLRIKE